MKKGHKPKKTNQTVIEFWIQQVSVNAPKDDSSCCDDGIFAISMQTHAQQQGSGDGDDQVDSGVSRPGAFPETDLTDETVAVRKDEDLEWRLHHLLEQLGDESFFNFQESWKGAVQGLLRRGAATCQKAQLNLQEQMYGEPPCWLEIDENIQKSMETNGNR